MSYSLTDALPHLDALEVWIGGFDAHGRTYREFYDGLDPHREALLRMIDTPGADWEIGRRFNAAMLRAEAHRSFLLATSAMIDDLIACLCTTDEHAHHLEAEALT